MFQAEDVRGEGSNRRAESSQAVNNRPRPPFKELLVDRPDAEVLLGAEDSSMILPSRYMTISILRRAESCIVLYTYSLHSPRTVVLSDIRGLGLTAFVDNNRRGNHLDRPAPQTFAGSLNVSDLTGQSQTFAC